MTRTIMEIRFGCPVCRKLFGSLRAAQGHVGEHSQAWKCGHCIQLFASPTMALQHIKEAHPGQQGRLESIDSPGLVAEKLTKGITLHRVQINMKSLLKEKPAADSTGKNGPSGKFFAIIYQFSNLSIKSIKFIDIFF